MYNLLDLLLKSCVHTPSAFYPVFVSVWQLVLQTARSVNVSCSTSTCMVLLCRSISVSTLAKTCRPDSVSTVDYLWSWNPPTFITLAGHTWRSHGMLSCTKGRSLLASPSWVERMVESLSPRWRGAASHTRLGWSMETSYWRLVLHQYCTYITQMGFKREE